VFLAAQGAFATGCRDSGAEVTTSDSGTASTDAASADAQGTDATAASDVGTDGATTTTADAVGDGTADAPAAIPGLVFTDDFAPTITVLDFGGATNAITVDKTTAHSGSASLKIAIPASGYTGASFKSAMPEDLSGFDSVTLWAKADVADAIDSLGLGNDATSSRFGAEWSSVPLTTSWQKIVIPLPAPSVATALDGLFYFACASGKKFTTVWLDDIQYSTLGSSVLGTPKASITKESQSIDVGGATGQIHGSQITYDIGGVTEVIKPGNGESPGWPWFTYASDNPSVATVDATGAITGVSVGSANISAALGGVPVTGAVAVTVKVASVPKDTAPTPTLPAANVIAIFSSAYTPIMVDDFLATWSTAKITDPFNIGTHAVKEYSALGYAGIEFFIHANEIDATSMTAFHVDVWTPDAKTLQVKLVDFGANGVYGGGDDTESLLTFNAGSSPALTNNAWVSLEIPISAFVTANPAWNRQHLAQLLFATADTTPVTAFVDNIYFHK
jgi:hypothetical protein